MIDGTLNDYLERLDRWTSRQGWLTSLAKIESSEKFRGGAAQPISGCTLITPTYGESKLCRVVYSQIHRARSAILEGLGLRCNLVPEACLHVTAADLISGAHYDARRALVPDLEVRLRDRVATLLSQQAQLDAPLEWRVSGLAFFQHALVCVLAPCSERDYEPISEMRRSIYGDEGIRALGVKTPLPFLAHITLAYYEEIPSLGVRQDWVGKYAELQSQLGCAEASFFIDQIDLRWFRDMVGYHQYRPRVGLRFGPTV